MLEKAKIDVNVDFTHKLCASLMLPPLRNAETPLSVIIGSLCIKHPNLFGGSEKLDVSWDKGLYDSNVLIAYRRPRPEWLSHQCFVVQHSFSLEVAVHGTSIDNFSLSGSGGVNLSRLSVGLDLNEPASSHWSSTTSIKFEHVHLLNDDGRSITRDLDGFPVTCSPHDSMVILKQESRYAKANDHSFSKFSMQTEQGIPVLSKWLIFNRFKFVATKGIKVGPAFLLASLTGGSIVGDMAPYQAFSIGGLGSVRGYGEGAVGSGGSCLVANSELALPLDLHFLFKKEGMLQFYSRVTRPARTFERELEAVLRSLGEVERSSQLVLDGTQKVKRDIETLKAHSLEIQHYGRVNQDLELDVDMTFVSNLHAATFRLTTPSMPFNKKTLYFGISNLIS